MNTTENINTHDQPCHRCGLKGHWANVCRTPKHFVNLYQASVKGKDKNAEMNFTTGDGSSDLSHMDVPEYQDDQNINLYVFNDHI